LAYSVEGDAVRVSKVQRFEAAWHQTLITTLEEWNSLADNVAFRDL
jgi:hypothetical protein